VDTNEDLEKLNYIWCHDSRGMW